MMKKILIFGMGKSGVSAARLALKQGYIVDIYDAKAPEQNKFLSEHLPMLEGVRHRYFMEFPSEMQRVDEQGYDFIVISPGVNPDSCALKNFRENGGKIISEVEFAYLNSHGEFIGITGTNGKTTTVSLCYLMFQKAFGSRVKLVGNVGTPISDEIYDEIEKGEFDRIYICELSSYQLELIHEFKANIGAILNLTPDHLDRHGDMQGYLNAKLMIAKNMDFQENDKLILNYDDGILKNLDFDPSDILYFSTRDENAHYFLKGDDLLYRLGEETVKIASKSDLNIFGEHNISNALCACAIALEYDVPLSLVQEALREFMPIEHRMEFVRKIGEVKFFNDSKATNPDASIPALKAMKGRTVLIAGGSDKKSDYREWILNFAPVEKAILIGVTSEDIAKVMDELGNHRYEFAANMKEAVNRAYALCKEDASIVNVLLSPACASFDQYENYESRGRDFKNLVNALS